MAFDYKAGGALGGLGGGAGYGIGSFFGDMAAGENRDEIARILANLKAEAGPSAFGSITEDPAMRGEELSSLNALKAIADAKGMDTSARVAQRQALDASNQNARARRGAITNSYAMRGMGGSGAELASQLAGEQSDATANAAASSQAAAEASQRALQAISGYGTTAANVRGQDWGEAAQRAKAQDAMSQFNAGQRVQKAGMDVGFQQQEAQRKRDEGGGIGSFIGAGLGALGGFL